MVGGTDEAFERARPYLEIMGKAVIHAGAPGSGQAAKICNNMLLGASMAATCETFVMAKKLGLDLQTFFDISSKASGQCWSMTSYCPVPGVGPETPADRDYEGGFAAALMLKDLRLAMEAAQSVDAYTPMGAAAETLYARFADLGGGGKDFSAIIKMIDDSWAALGGRYPAVSTASARSSELPPKQPDRADLSVDPDHGRVGERCWLSSMQSAIARPRADLPAVARWIEMLRMFHWVCTDVRLGVSIDVVIAIIIGHLVEDQLAPAWHAGPLRVSPPWPARPPARDSDASASKSSS